MAKQPAPSRNSLVKWPKRQGQGDPFYDALQQAQVEHCPLFFFGSFGDHQTGQHGEPPA